MLELRLLSVKLRIQTHFGLRIVHSTLNLGDGGSEFICDGVLRGVDESPHGVQYSHLGAPFSLLQDVLQCPEDGSSRLRREELENALNSGSRGDADDIALIHVEIEENR